MLEKYAIGDLVEIKGEDSYFKGHIVSVFKKRSGKIRCVIENSDGLLHIYNLRQLVKVEENEGSNR